MSFQADLFGTPQPDLFAAHGAPLPEIGPSPDRARQRLLRIVGEARAAETMPWTRSKEKLYRAIVPQLALNLPADEGEQLVLAFEREIERLMAA